MGPPERAITRSSCVLTARGQKDFREKPGEEPWSPSHPTRITRESALFFAAPDVDRGTGVGWETK